MHRPTVKILSSLEAKLRRLKADYADLRYVELERVKIRTKNGKLDDVKETRSSGVGFRVLQDGAFGFSATDDLSEKALDYHLTQALAMAARFSKIRHAEVKLAAVKPVRDRWQTPIRKDPRSLSLNEKIKPLVEAEKKLKSHSWIDSATGLLDFVRKKVIFISNEGSRTEQTLYRTGGRIQAETWLDRKTSGAGGREKIRRSWPSPSGLYLAQGYEGIQKMNFPKEASRVAQELKELRTSPETPAGKFDLILKGSILALQIHETFGHASESDRVYGYEDNFGGRTFLNPGLLGGAEVASEHVNLVSEGLPQAGCGTGTFAYDDEGVKAKRVDIVRNGIFRGYLTSRETANFLNQPGSTGNMVAEDGSHYPLIRMTNTSLLPGKGTLEELIAGVKDGFLLDNELSWSIDEMRLDFHIGAEAGYRIRNGKIQGLVRFPFYYGNTLDFWRSCDQIAGKKEWDFWGFPDCGKGGPYQAAFTGHGLAPARFRHVEFGER